MKKHTLILINLFLTAACSLENSNQSPIYPPKKEVVIQTSAEKVPSEEKMLAQETAPESKNRYSDAVRQNVEALSRIQTLGHFQGKFNSNDGKRCTKEDCISKFVSIYVSTKHDDENPGECSGVALTPKLVLTNLHCIKNINLDSKYLSLQYQIAVKVPDFETQIGEVVFVKSVKAFAPFAFNESEKQGHQYKMDYAILELSEELKNITPPAINQNYGIHDGEVYTVMQFSPYRDVPQQDKITVKEYKCKAVTNSLYAPAIQSENFPVVYFSNCPIGPGNSGSPIYNDKGELVGLMAGQLNPGTLMFLNYFASYKKILAAPLSPIGWGNMLTCLPKIRNNSIYPEVDSACDSLLDNLSQKDAVKIDPVTRESLFTVLKEKSLESETFQFTPSKLSLKRSTIFDWIYGAAASNLPSCIKSSALENLPHQLTMDLDATIPKISESGQFNKEVVSITIPVNITLGEIEKLKDGQKAKIRVFHTEALKSEADKFNENRLLFSADIGLCS